MRRPTARRTDPPTAHDAARFAAPRAGTNRYKALAALTDAGPVGLTDFELADRTGIAQTSIGVRRGELTKVGMVVALGDTTRLAPSGTPAQVWVLAEYGPEPEPVRCPPLDDVHPDWTSPGSDLACTCDLAWLGGGALAVDHATGCAVRVGWAQLPLDLS